MLLVHFLAQNNSFSPFRYLPCYRESPDALGISDRKACSTSLLAFFLRHRCDLADTYVPFEDTFHNLTSHKTHRTSSKIHFQIQMICSSYNFQTDSSSRFFKYLLCIILFFNNKFSVSRLPHQNNTTI